MTNISLQAAALLAAVVAFLAYVNTLDCGLVYDDDPGIVKNQDLRPNVSWENLIRNDFWGTPMNSSDSHKSYRPLCVATFRLNYLVHELQPMGYHLVNVLLHSAVCYLYVQLCGLVFREVWPALIAGLLFAVHPIHTEAVAGVVGRADVMAGLFFMAAMISYCKTTSSNKAITGVAWLLLSLLLCICAVLSKEIGITVTAVFLIYDYFIANKMDLVSTYKFLSPLATKHTKRSLLGFLIRSVTVSVFTIAFMALRLKINHGMPKFTIHDNPPITFPTPFRQLQWLHLCFVNAWLLLNPFHLSCDWRMGGVHTISSIADPWNLATVATLVAVVALGVYGIGGPEHSRKVVLLALSLIVFPYLPASNLLFPVGFYVAERILYIPSMGICILAAYGVWYILQHTQNKSVKNVVTAGITCLFILHSMKTVQRNRAWYSNMQLYLTTMQIFPTNALMMNNLAYELKTLGNRSEAEDLLIIATELAPNITLPHTSLGLLLKDEERFEEAKKEFWKAAKLAPSDSKPEQIASIYYHLATLIAKNESRSQLEKAVKIYDSALQIKPGFCEYLHSKGYALMKLERYLEAKLVFEEALKDNSEHIGSTYKLGDCLMNLGEKKRAEPYFRKVLSLSESEPMAKFQLGIILLDSTDVERLHEAEKLLLEVLEIEPENVNLLMSLGLVYYGLDDKEKAEEMFLRTLEFDETHKSTLYNLGFTYLNQKRYQEAQKMFLKLIVYHPHHTNGHAQLGTVYVHMNQLQKAVEAYEAALNLDSNHILSLLNLGIVKTELNQLQEAIDLLTRALKLDPTNETVIKQLTKTQEKLKAEQQQYTANQSEPVA